MRTIRSVMLASLLAGIHFSDASRLDAQSYGLGDQVLTIGAAAFQPRIGTATTYTFDNSVDGYLSLPASSAEFIAPLSLPDGAEIFGFCVDEWGLPGGGGFLGARIQVTKLPDVGQDPGIYLVPGTVVEQVTLTPGYQSLCNTSPVSYTFHTTGDVDGLGIRNLAHRVYLSLSQASFGAVRILWRRQVSSAPATPTFGDVPISDGTFSFVEALAASGVTAGCGGGNYCPDTPITRRQMAVFLSKALGLHWPN